MPKAWRALAIIGLSLSLLHVPSAGALPLSAPLTLIVLNPDGTPAIDAVAVARIAEDTTDGVRSVPVYESSPDPSGLLEVRIPTTDPYIEAHPDPARLRGRHQPVHVPRPAHAARRGVPRDQLDDEPGATRRSRPTRPG